MKKQLFKLFVGSAMLFLVSCEGSKGSDESAADTTLTEQEMEEVINMDNTSQDLLEEADSLEAEADQILKELNQ